ncbi:hypothetical protein K0M31_005669 [Melipona bicolor]|uniref:Uncharacterized protein n=1 Tax=Melipona bicolor TaxID=60889 RepID=A0AA40KM88_9HYME|nr:hypothetical protein K0M31_005669 [Melipona bicolor]
MEKEQPDSLATVAVVSEKMPHPPHSNYAPSEVYSSAEPPPVSLQFPLYIENINRNLCFRGRLPSETVSFVSI